MSSDDAQFGDGIDWPLGWGRTDPAERSRNNRFEARLNQSIRDLEDELRRVGVDDWRLSTGAEHQKRNPNFPYADARPDDPGAVVRWTMDGAQYAAACDRYSRLRDNIRALYLYVREKRKMSTRPVVTGESEFSNARLPPGEDIHPDVSSREKARGILGVSQNPDADEIRSAFQKRLIEAHPDHGGSVAEVTRVRKARDLLL